MDILYLVRNFSTPFQPGTLRPWAMAKALKDLDHNVIVITANTHYMADDYSFRQLQLWSKEIQDNLTVIRVKLPSGYRRTTTKRRIFDYLCYSFLSFFAGLGIGKVDVVIAATPPPFSLLFGYLLAILKQARFIVEEKDLYPDVAIALNYIKPNGVVAKCMQVWHSFFRKKCDKVITATPGIYNMLIEKGIDKNKIVVIPNAYGILNETNIFVTNTYLLKFETVLKEFDNKFIVLYAGGMGYANEIFTILKAAKIIQRKSNEIKFVFLGEGEKKSSYIDFCWRNKIKICSFLSVQPRVLMPLILKRAGVCIHALKRVDFLKCVLANKIFDALSNGCPMIFSGRGDTADLLKKANAGLIVEPEDSKALAEAILHLYANPEEKEKMGRNGKKFISENYPRSRLLRELSEVLCL